MAPSSLLGWALEHAHAHLIFKPPKPEADFSDQTVIVTGSNTGIGLETARWLVRLGAAKVILAVRTMNKGKNAADDIRASTKCEASVVEVWPLDMASSKSVEDFVSRAQKLDRLDVVVANAGIYLFDFELVEGNESTITVNVINTFMLAILLLPILRDTSVRFDKETVVTFTGSFVHWLTNFPERHSEHIFQDLANEKTARMVDRYNVSKLIHLLLTREFANALSSSTKPGNVTTSHANPGYVKTNLLHHMKSVTQTVLNIIGARPLMARSPEVGGRVMAHAAQGGPETHGQYLSDCKVGSPSLFVRSEESLAVGKQLWEELLAILEEKHQGISSLI